MSETDAFLIEGSRASRSVVDDLPVTVEALLGVATVKVGDLRRLSSGDCFTLDTLLGDPVELRLNGVTIASGELVTVGDNFGIRIKAVTQA